MSFGDHTKCADNSLLHRTKKRTFGFPSRPTIASKSVLGKPPSVVSKDVVVSPIVANNNSKTEPIVSEFIKKKAHSSWNWQRWIQRTYNFMWIPKMLNVCASNPTEPTPSSGSTLTLVPSLSPLCDAGGTNSSLDC